MPAYLKDRSQVNIIILQRGYDTFVNFHDQCQQFNFVNQHGMPTSKVKYQFFEINYVNEIKQLYCSLAMMEGY